MTKDTENRVNTPGGEPNEEPAENGTREAESETAEEKACAGDNPEKQTASEETECDDGESPASEDAPEDEKESGCEDKTCGRGAEPQIKSDDKKNGEADAAVKENEKLKKDLDTANEQLKQQKEVFMRTVAEYDNYRKRTEREKASVYSDATAAAVKEILSVEDNLSRALAQKECSAEDLRRGVEMVEKQMQKALKKLGVTEMGNEGETFDPALHNAVSHIEDDSISENTIAEVFQKGYMLDGKVIRHAMVKVAN